MKDKIRLVSVALLVFVVMILFGMSVTNIVTSVSQKVSKELTPYLENSAKCESLSGKYGSGKCFVDGKEIILGELL